MPYLATLLQLTKVRSAISTYQDHKQNDQNNTRVKQNTNKKIHTDQIIMKKCTKAQHTHG
jgi:hypothetical protein